MAVDFTKINEKNIGNYLIRHTNQRNTTKSRFVKVQRMQNNIIRSPLLFHPRTICQ